MKIKFLMLSIIILLFFMGCEEQEPRPSISETFFAGKHKLHSLTTFDKQTKEVDANFFLFVGNNYKAEEKIVKKAMFLWEKSDGEIMITQLPFEKIRLCINDSIKEPYCKFRWWGAHSSLKFESNWQSYIIYTVIYLRSEHIKTEIDLDFTHEN